MPKNFAHARERLFFRFAEEALENAGKILHREKTVSTPRSRPLLMPISPAPFAAKRSTP
jgi:hypothetical protein